MSSQTTRRAFLKLTTAAASVTAAEFSHAMPASKGIALIVDSGSALTSAESVQWAVEKFREALAARVADDWSSGEDFRQSPHHCWT
jgi:hypothetical protein